MSEQNIALTPLRRAWLRELGIERVWPATAAAVPAPAPQTEGAPVAVASVPVPERVAVAAVPVRDAGPAVAAAAAAASGSPSVPAARPASPREALRAATAAPSMPRLAPGPTSTAAPAAPPVITAVPIPSDPDAAWEQLRAEVSTCTACALCKTRTNAVFGSGPRTARWLLIGEGPGEQEDKQGLPFVGRSGQLLDNMLASVGVARDAVFVTNVVKCRPPRNRNPEPEEIAACRPFLERQLALLAPERALSVGRVSAQSLLGTDASIGSLRGRMHHLALGGRQVPLVVSYHPAYLLRSPLEKAKAWRDMQLAVASGG